VTHDSEAPRPITREDLGFLMAKAAQRWNELLAERFAAAGYAEVRPSYGSILVPLFEEDGLRLGELARRARLSKQTMTTMVRLLERDGLVTRDRDPLDGRAFRIKLTQKGRRLQPVAAEILEDLDQLTRARIGDRRVAALRKALSELLDLERQ
jgi:DNA-binding MarR family transcriptional regulator